MSTSDPTPEDAYDGEEAGDGDGDEALRAYLPASFGKQTVTRNVAAELEQTRRAPAPKPKPKPKFKSAPSPGPRMPMPSGSGGTGDSSSSASSSSSDDDDDDEFPTSHELTIPAHTKPVSSISLDASGTRFATTSHDCQLNLYDFHAMSTTHLRPFRSVEPVESHHVHFAHFSPLDGGRRMLVVSASAQAKVLDRDGDLVGEFVKGDPYLRDMHNTKGHVSELTGGSWSPVDPGVVVTAATDSTVRIWDVEARRQHRDVIVHKSRSGKGGRSRMCAVAWSGGVQGGGGSVIGSMALDGVLEIWAGAGPYSRPVMEVRDAHVPETWTAGLAFSSDGRLLVTRGEDQCIKLWDTRKLKSPITTRTSFPTPPYPTSNIIFSPPGTNILCGSSAGSLEILSAATLQTTASHAISPGHAVVTATWHPKINHILLGSADGSVHVLYSATTSSRGALHVLARAPRKRHVDDETCVAPIAADDIVSASRSAAATRKVVDRRRPAMPPNTPWGKSQPDQGHIDRSIALSSMRDEDPREALLKYADVAKRDPMFTAAWRETQPVTVYANIEDEEEEEEETVRAGKRVKR